MRARRGFRRYFGRRQSESLYPSLINRQLTIRRSIEYLHLHPDCLLLDCTYKTNKFGIPLLHVAGIDSIGLTFTIAIFLLNQETESDYKWAANIIKNLFPKGVFPSVIATDNEQALINAIRPLFPIIRTKMVLCYWYASKNVLTNCKRYFETEERWEAFFNSFKAIVFCKTEDEFKDSITE